MMIPRSEYVDAIAALEKAVTQLEPDGRNCAICQDGDHQAFECRFNPVLAIKQRDILRDVIDTIHESLHSKLGVR